jgi:hypothetical protein
MDNSTQSHLNLYVRCFIEDIFGQTHKWMPTDVATPSSQLLILFLHSFSFVCPVAPTPMTYTLVNFLWHLFRMTPCGVTNCTKPKSGTSCIRQKLYRSHIHLPYNLMMCGHLEMILVRWKSPDSVVSTKFYTRSRVQCSWKGIINNNIQSPIRMSQTARIRREWWYATSARAGTPFHARVLSSNGLNISKVRRQ